MLSLLLQTPPPVEQTEVATNHNVLHLMFNADPLVQLSLLILLIFSVVSWAIIIAKHKQIKRSEKKTAGFYEIFWGAKKLTELNPKRGLSKGPAYNIYSTALRSLEGGANPTKKESITREIRRAYEDEMAQIEYGVPFLATTASTAPFIGLFGTVWGILNAFWKIGQQGSSSLSLVGPHIAEALIATAFGLAAAIPAVIFYNTFVAKIRRFSKDLEDFTEDLADRVSHEYFGAR